MEIDMSGIYRAVRTTNEKTQYYACTCNEMMVPVHVRSKRHAKVLPGLFDDLMRYSMRNWKHYRKTQWKNNNKEVV
jgi:predicted alpha/beta hydrolase